MDALLFAINMEVLLLQMRILGGERRLAEKYILNETERRMRNKLTRDRKMIISIMRKTLLELTESGHWFTVMHAVQSIESNALLLARLRIENEKLKSSFTYAHAKLLEKKYKYDKELSCFEKKKSSLLDQLKDCQSNTTIQIKFAEKWLGARAQSLELQLETQPPPSPKAVHENYIHDEIHRVYELQIKERENSLVYWESRYLKDTKDIKNRVQDVRDKLLITTKRRDDLETLYTLHKGEMRGWLTFKKERAARLAREERVRKAATRIQAWWRGVMVQRSLGAFRYLKTNKKGPVKSKKK